MARRPIIPLQEQINYVRQSKEGMKRMASTQKHLKQIDTMQAIEDSLETLHTYVIRAEGEINRRSSTLMRPEHDS
jgi:hypothetical protein